MDRVPTRLYGRGRDAGRAASPGARAGERVMADRIQQKPMTLEQVGNAIQELVQDATSYMEAELSPQRAKATEYNRGDPLRNEETGRSQIVLTVVRDVVGAVKPSLVRLFLPTSGHIIRYDA